MYFFVYGTLKVGGYFAKYLYTYRTTSEVAILKGFDLHDLRNFPGIVPGLGEVKGEIHTYMREEAVLREMDRIEGYDEENPTGSLFIRHKGKVTTENGEEVDAWFYEFNQGLPTGAKKIPDGVWDI